MKKKKALTELTNDQRIKACKILGRQIDFQNMSFVGGGSWEGGYEDISLSELFELTKYLIQEGFDI